MAGLLALARLLSLESVEEVEKSLAQKGVRDMRVDGWVGSWFGSPSQWLFLVPVKGGIRSIVHPPIGRKNDTYILPIPPFTGTRNNHWPSARWGLLDFIRSAWKILKAMSSPLRPQLLTFRRRGENRKRPLFFVEISKSLQFGIFGDRLKQQIYSKFLIKTLGGL